MSSADMEMKMATGFSAPSCQSDEAPATPPCTNEGETAISLGAHEAMQWHSHRTQRELVDAHRSLSEGLHQLRVAVEYLNAFIEPLEAGVLATDADGRTMIVNSAAERLLGIERKRLIGRSAECLDSRISPPISLARATRSGRTVPPMRRVLRRSDGSQFLVETTLRLLRDSTGGVFGCVLVLKDLSPLHEMERKLQQAEQLASIGKVAAALAHDVRSPVAVIEGFGHLLLQSLQPSDPCRRYAESIVQAAAHLNQAVTGTLILAQEPRLDMRDIAPLALLEEVKEMVEREVEGMGLADIEVHVEVAEEDVEGDAMDGTFRLWADRDQIIRALMNLCRNAIEAMPSGGSLTLRCSASPRSTWEKPALRLSVADTGVGVPPEIRRRLFDPFETTKEDGVGLGLAIVKKVAELHGGSVSFETSAGNGTVFHMDLPAVRT